MPSHNKCWDYDQYDNNCYDECDYDQCYDYDDCCPPKPQKCHYFRPAPYCQEPASGAQVAAILCPCKVVPASSSSGSGFATASLVNKQRFAFICIKAVKLTTTAECISGILYDNSTGESNVNEIKTFTLKRFDVYPGYNYNPFDNCGPCKEYCYVAKCRWSCDDTTQPLTPTNAELLACGRLNVEVAGEIRGQLCHYESSH